VRLTKPPGSPSYQIANDAHRLLTAMTDSEWLSPRGLLDYYFDQAVDIQEAEKELYLAVVSGEVGAPQWPRAGS